MTGDTAKVRHIAPQGAFNGMIKRDSRKVMMMKISKCKKELARIISENGGWCGAANLALFGKVSGRCYMLKTDEWPEYDVTIRGFYINARDVVSDFHAKPFANWHQTILSRAEYFHLYPVPGELCGKVTEENRHEPVWTNPPSIEQLAKDYRNAKDCAERKQQEADDAKGDADARLKALEIAAEDLGFKIEPITTKQDWL